MIGFDKKSYNDYFDRGISAIIDEYRNKYTDIIVDPNARDRIWEAYCEFNYHCKEKYMSSAEEHLLDRHKVVACYMYAIEKAYVLSSVSSLKSGDRTHLFLNEELAFCFGMSMLRALILDLAEKVEQTDEITKAFEGDILLPDCTHGDYKNNFLSQLHFTHEESNYNVLSLAESLYLIECYNLMKNGLPTDCLKISSPKS